MSRRRVTLLLFAAAALHAMLEPTAEAANSGYKQRLLSASFKSDDIGDANADDWRPPRTERAPGQAAERGAAADAGERSGLVLHQMLSGKDIAVGASQVFKAAKSMQNFEYFVGDWSTGEVAVFDGAWDPAGLEVEAARLGLTIVAFVATHYHWDHIGDRERRVPGMQYFVDRQPQHKKPPKAAPVAAAYIHELEREEAIEKCGVIYGENVIGVHNNTVVWIGGARLRFIHTPGHSRGGMSIALSYRPGGKPTRAEKVAAKLANLEARAADTARAVDVAVARRQARDADVARAQAQLDFKRQISGDDSDGDNRDEGCAEPGSCAVLYANMAKLGMRKIGLPFTCESPYSQLQDVNIDHIPVGATVADMCPVSCNACDRTHGSMRLHGRLRAALALQQQAAAVAETTQVEAEATAAAALADLEAQKKLPQEEDEDLMVQEKNILTGDTLFPGSCGRIDLPESDKEEMYKSLQNVRQSSLPCSSSPSSSFPSSPSSLLLCVSNAIGVPRFGSPTALCSSF